MSNTLQSILVAAIVLGALVYLILRARKKAGCGKGCDCTGRKLP